MEQVDLFDDIMLFANGHIIYHGPNSGILNFFKALGFDCPVRKDRASFLQVYCALVDPLHASSLPAVRSARRFHGAQEVTTAIGQNQYASEALRASKVCPSAFTAQDCISATWVLSPSLPCVILLSWLAAGSQPG